MFIGQRITINLFLLLLTYSVTTQAADNVDENNSTSELPDLTLLEFIGRWETDEGEWINPVDFIDGDFAQLIESATTDESSGAEFGDLADDNSDIQTND